MRQKFSLLLTLAAWLLATGGQWDLVQTFAWGQMFVGNARTLSLTDAVEKTFSGEQCPLCKVVETGKQAQSNAATPGANSTGKIVLTFAPVSTLLADYLPVVLGAVSSFAAPTSAERSAPPLPPPRSLV